MGFSTARLLDPVRIFRFYAQAQSLTKVGNASCHPSRGERNGWPHCSLVYRRMGRENDEVSNCTAARGPGRSVARWCSCFLCGQRGWTDGGARRRQLDTTASPEIRVHRGHYMAPAAGWHIDIDVRGITVAGGYDDGCTTASADAALTVLDGGFSTRPLTIDTSFAVQPNPTTHDITVRGLTFANGLGDRVGGLKISDAGPITSGSILVEGNIFRNNSATVYQQDNSAGGLLAATDGADGSGNVFLIVRGNLFVGNEAPDGAAAMLFSNNAIDVSNNTVTRNQSFEPERADSQCVRELHVFRHQLQQQYLLGKQSGRSGRYV